MDSFEINKIIASILLVALLIIGISKVSNIVFKVDKPESPAYKVELPDNDAKNISEEDTAKVEDKVDISALMALGDITHGEKVFKKCSACHSIEAGGSNKIGPALYNVVGRKIAAVEDYKYSKALV
jgi:cytochrome c